MKTITRYVAIEFLKVFLLALAGMTLFMFVVVGAREAMRHGLGPGPMLKILPYVLPESMRYSLPCAALLAACSVYGRMAGDNEVVAIKALGISPFSLMVPSLVVSFLASALAVCVNDLAVSWGLPGREQMVFESIESIVYGVLRTPPRSYSDEKFAITVKDVQGRRLIWPNITIYGKPGETPMRISAREATLQRNPANNTLEIRLTDSFYEGPGGVEAGWVGEIIPIIIPLGRTEDEDERSPSNFALRDLPSSGLRHAERMTALQQSLAARAAFAMLAGELDQLDDQAWQNHQSTLQAAQYRMNRFRIEPWRRWANGFSCFFFVLVGVPLSIRRRNSDFISNFFLAFLPILLVYYPLFLFGVESAKEETLPAPAVWLGNFAMCLWGAWLVRRVMRY
jgi:lipopolysaccharide export system permease protein